jgi:hypothetical protein
MRSDVLTAVKMSRAFWVVTPSGLVDRQATTFQGNTIFHETEKSLRFTGVREL